MRTGDSGAETSIPDGFVPVLDVLGACVLSDHRKRDVELIEFCHSAHCLARFLYPEHILSRRDLKLWLSDNGDRLEAMVDDPEQLRTMMAKITDEDLRPLLLKAIFAISICDYEMADEESAFIQLALDSWKPLVVEPQLAEAFD